MNGAGDEDAFDGWRIAGILCAVLWSYACWAALWIILGCWLGTALVSVARGLWP